MSISGNQYHQLRDYLGQILGLSSRGGLPKITQSNVATCLGISSPGVSLFLSGKTASLLKGMRNFVETYPLEIAKWPRGADKIRRILNENDALYFLNPQPTQGTVVKRQVTEDDLSHLSSLKLVSRLFVQNTQEDAQNQINPSIVISYRGHLSEKDAQGMIFDHMCFQTITKSPTAVLLPADKVVSLKVKNLFIQALKAHPAALPKGEKHQGITVPPYLEEFADSGLLVIPGRVRAIENEPIRLKHEYKIIREALNRGQPILGICAGSWRLFEQLLMWTKHPEKLNQPAINLQNWHVTHQSLVDASDHCYNGGMIRLGSQGVNAVCNVQIHGIDVNRESLLRNCLGDTASLKVNSVHWKVVNPQKLTPHIIATALARKDPRVTIKSRTGELMNPENGVIEALEMMNGAPILGVQWHPEGYNQDLKSPHCRLLRTMVMAGNTYAVKRRMLHELMERVDGANGV